MAKAYTKIRRGLEEALHHAKTGRGRAVYRLHNVKKKLLKNPKVRAEYERLGPGVCPDADDD